MRYMRRLTAMAMAAMLTVPAVTARASQISAAESAAEAAQAAEGVQAAAEAAQTVEEMADSDSVRMNRIRFASDYKEVYDAIKAIRGYTSWYYDPKANDAWIYDDVAEADSATFSAAGAAREESAPKTADTGDYSETNVRTDGVDEADVVKTDGRFIYILRGGRKLSIVKADAGDLEHAATVDLPCEGEGYGDGAKEFFINGKMLHIIVQETSSGYGTDKYYVRTASGEETRVLTYDISTPEAPMFVGEITQDGAYRQARMRDGYFYVFTEWRPYVDDTFEDSVMVPRVAGEEMDAASVCIPDVLTDASYLIVTAADASDPTRVTDSKALLSGASQLYVSTGGIYSINPDYRYDAVRTEIVKFTYESGAILGRAAASLRGEVDDTFSVDEYEGNLRVLATYTGSEGAEFMELIGRFFGLDYYDSNRWVRHNAVYVLNEDLERLGSLRGLAEGEDIKSARFFGDTAYFVTFRNTDPLFSVDLSDPASPRVIGELKIPGFSEYLHPMGDGILAGVGYDADPDSGSVSGVKLSLFDISDPTGVKEFARTVIPGMTWCPSIENYKSIFAEAGKGLIGFFGEDRYFLYKLEGVGDEAQAAGGAVTSGAADDEARFERVLLYDFYEDGLQGMSDHDNMRGLYIGRTFYLAGSGYVAAFDMENGFAKLGVLRLG